MKELGEIASLDWDEFFDTRIVKLAPEAPLGGIANGGWKLVYTEEMNRHLQYSEEADGFTDLSFSLGLVIRNKNRHPDHGRVTDAIPGLPAAESGIAPGMRLVAVNSRRWSPDLLREAVRAAQGASEPMELLVENADFYRTYRVDYHGGERYPHLVRDKSHADLLTDILSPQAGPQGQENSIPIVP